MASQPAPDRPYRPIIIARRHGMASGHYWTSLAGFQVLEAGGNAGVTAPVATMMASSSLPNVGPGF